MILFAASDAGPAQYLASVICKLDIPYRCLCSPISKKVFDSYNILSITQENEINFNDIQCIITGTCLGEGLDKIVLRKALEKNILTISVIEHWSFYIERFKLANKLILPDYILVNDDIAKKESIKSGLPVDKIISVGNPYLEELSSRKLSPKLKSDWHKIIGIEDKKVITFISEIYREDFPRNSPNYQGFDEYEVLEALIILAKDIDYGILIRLHPTENKIKYQDYLNHEIILDGLNDYDSTIMNSDLLIGMGSMFLIEASLFRSDIISFRPNQRYPFIGNQLGACSLFEDISLLKEHILKGGRISNRDFHLEVLGSTERIINLIKTLLSDKIRIC
jgi:hypothetical protein